MDAAPVAYRETFARLIGFLRPYKVSLIVSIVLAAASQAAQIAMIVITGAVVNRVEAHDRHGLDGGHSTDLQRRVRHRSP